MLEPSYQVYATLLDSFAWYKRDESEVAQQDLLDRINRVEKPRTDAQLRGMAFEARVEMAAVGGVYPTEPVLCHDKKVPAWLIEQFAKGRGAAARQVYVETLIPTLYGPVKVYGMVDEILGDTAADIKTTSNYEFPKYLRAWQHPCYLEALRPMGISRFVYRITDFEGYFEEEYSYKRSDTDRVISEVAQLVEFLEANRARINNRKIFNLPAEGVPA
jgi:hypothetical protein